MLCIRRSPSTCLCLMTLAPSQLLTRSELIQYLLTCYLIGSEGLIRFLWLLSRIFASVFSCHSGDDSLPIFIQYYMMILYQCQWAATCTSSFCANTDDWLAEFTSNNNMFQDQFKTCTAPPRCKPCVPLQMSKLSKCPFNGSTESKAAFQEKSLPPRYHREKETYKKPEVIIYSRLIAGRSEVESDHTTSTLILNIITLRETWWWSRPSMLLTLRSR